LTPHPEEPEPSIGTIRLQDVKDSYGEEVADRLLQYCRHRRDEFGEYWLSDELDELLELDALEFPGEEETEE